MSDSLRPPELYLPGFSVYGIAQARILEWVAISFSIYRKTNLFIVCLKLENSFVVVAQSLSHV